VTTVSLGKTPLARVAAFLIHWSVLLRSRGWKDFSVLNNLGAEQTPSEEIDYICPLKATRSLVGNKITTQDLVNQCILVNSVRIGLNLQLVE
jgi:hypothetical protein